MLSGFIRRILTFSAIISVIAYFLYRWLIPQFYLPIFPFLIVFFIIISIGVHSVLTKAGKQRISKFSTFYMGSISIKLFIYIIFMVVYVFADKPNALSFLLNFLVLYFLYTFFETWSLLSDLKKQQAETKTS
jgi:hypothetical protein